LKEENFGGIIFGTSGASTPVVRNMPEANGVFVSAPIIYNPKHLYAKEAQERYFTRYQKPFTHYAASGYDFMKLLTGMLEDKEICRESVKRLLEDGFIHPGIFGDLDVKPGEHDITFPLYPARIVDGELEYLRP
jgi:branched-chain amino acid transport system substrate-binding protein